MKDSTRRTILCAGMLLIQLFIILSQCGCSVVRELKAPPFPMAMIHHTRAVGLEGSIPNQAGDSILRFRFGWFSDTTSLLPAGENPLHIVKVSDTFKLGNTFSLSPSTTITEDLVTGWEGTPPPSRHLKLFGPVEKTNTVTYDTNRPPAYSYEPSPPMQLWPLGVLIHTNGIPFIHATNAFIILTNSVKKPSK